MNAEMLDGYKVIKLGDKVTFDQVFKKYPPDISEFTFTNLYMWRDSYQFRWKITDDTLILLSTKENGKIAFFPPVGAQPVQTLDSLLPSMQAAGKAVELHRVPEALAQDIGDLNKHFRVIEDRDNWDYLHLVKDMSSLEGPGFADFRKKLGRFKRDHPDIEYKRLDATMVEKCLEMQEEWCNLKACKESEGLTRENAAIKDIFEHWEILGFKGCVMVENEHIVGYALGEWLNPATIVCHVEKANLKPSYFGSYQAMSKSFADHCANGFEFINREQDLGEPGLRRSKESYNPSKMVKKFKIIIA